MRKTILTYEKCKEEALKYKTRSEFKKGHQTAYFKCHKNNWNELFDHMEEVIKPKGYWTYEKCREEALKYEMKYEFAKSKGWAYNISLSNGWLDEICSHMKSVGNFKKRCIYSYEFPNNVVYVGLTLNFNQRWQKRILDCKDVVSIYIKENNIYPIKMQLTTYIDKDEASILEGKFLEKYKMDGWTILNRNKTGSIGGNVVKWTYEECKKEADKYETLFDFRKNNINCYSAIFKNGWQKNILKNLKRTFKNKYWNLEKCREEALKYNRRIDFNRNCKGGYMAARSKGWLNEICSHMINLRNGKTIKA